MSLACRLAADVVVILHAGYVLYVLLGQLAILLGIVRRWNWIRNPWFRWSHLAAIAIVVAESLLEITCPLTTLEQWLRRQSGSATYDGDFLGNCVHDLLFFDFAPETFTVIYTAFGLLVVGTFVLAPPRRR